MSQKTITVGSVETPANIDTNFSNIQDNFSEIYPLLVPQDVAIIVDDGINYIGVSDLSTVITIPADIKVQSGGSIQSPVNAGSTLDLSVLSGVRQYFCYNLSTNSFILYSEGEIDLTNINKTIFVFGVLHKFLLFRQMMCPHTVDGVITGYFYRHLVTNVMFPDGEYIDFRLAKYQIVIPSSMVIGHGAYLIVPGNAGSILTIPETVATYYLGFNAGSGALEIIDDTEYLPFVHAGNYVLCSLRSDSICDAMFPHYVNGSFLNGDTIDQDKDLPILPDTLYFLIGESQTIYKSSMVGCNRKFDKMRFALMDETNLRVDSFCDSLRLTPAELGSALSLKISTFDKNADEATYYTKPVSRVVTDPSGVVNTTPKILCIGDSLTGAAAAFRYQLVQMMTARGITPEFVGTGQDTDTLRHEGIGGYGYTDFVGVANHNNTDPIPVTPSGLATRVGNTNSFLKLADATDKASHPDWCYTNSYPDAELTKAEINYATNPALGDYYIFDYANYLTDHSVSTPDAIHIALGVNDVSKNWFTLSKRVECFNWMINRIRVAQPTVPIIITPYHPVFQSFARSTLIAQQAAAIIAAVHTLQVAGDVNIWVAATFAHMPKSFIYPETSLSAATGRDYSTVDLSIDYVHPSLFGYKCYAKSLEAIILARI